MVELRVNKAKEKLAKGEVAVTLASWGYGGADALERLIDLEPDAIWLEGEHGEVDFSNIGELTRAVDLIGASPIVRVHQNEPGVIYRTLDLGAQGIAVPHVNTREEAEAVLGGERAGGAGCRPCPAPATLCTGSARRRMVARGTWCSHTRRSRR